MKDDLLKNHEITASTLYDRPPEQFKPISVNEKHELLMALGKDYPVFVRNSSSNETILTRMNAAGDVELRPDRPGLLISSTSWTEDEDFSLLLKSLQGARL